MTSTTAANPCTATATATNPSVSGSTTTVSLTVPAACVTVPRTVQVTVVDSGGAHSSASVTLSSAAQPITLLTAYTPAVVLSISVTLDGWNLTTTWSYTPPRVSCRVKSPAGSTATCTADVRSEVRNLGFFGTYTYYVVEVETTSATDVVWEVTFYLDDPFYNNVTDVGNSILFPDEVRKVSCAMPPGSKQLVVDGGATGNFRQIRASTSPRVIEIVRDSPATANLLQGCS